MTDARARLAAAALVIVAVWEIAVLVSAGRAAPSRADWEAVAAAIPATIGPDQLIVFAPRWIDPVGRRWLGSRLSLEHAARMDTARYREIWEVSVRGHAAPDVEGLPPSSERTFGPIRLRRFAREAPPMVIWSLTEGRRICEIDFEPRLGLVIPLRHAFAMARRPLGQVPLGSELQVYAGLDDYKKRSVNRATARIQVLIDGDEVAHGVLGNDTGWVALPPVATQGGVHDLQIVARVDRPVEPIEMAVCVAAEARERRR
jgi:hypothetical protein